MDLQTTALIEALGSVSLHTPRVVRELASGTPSPQRQREYGGLLLDLGELLQAHADDLERGVIQPTTPITAGSSSFPEP